MAAPDTSEPAVPEAEGATADRPAPWWQKLTRGVRPYLLIAAAVALVWGHTVRFEFVWDDKYFIVQLESIRSLANVPTMFTDLSAQADLPEINRLFRPLRNVHYTLLLAATGGGEPRPWIFHLANLVWHAAAAMLLFAVTRRLLHRQAESQPSPPPHVDLLALCAGLAYAVHPVVSEVVCWAKGLDDLMATVFVLGAALCLLHTPLQRTRYALSLLLFAVALYSKVAAAPFALLVPLLFLFYHRLDLRRTAVWSAGYVGVAAVYIVHRHLVLGQTSQTSSLTGGYVQTLVDMFEVAVHYGRLLLGIPPFLIDYSFMQGGHAITEPVILAGVVMVVVGMTACVACLLRRRLLAVGLGLAWLGLFLLPVSNLVPMMQYMAERFLYLPLAGFLLAVAGLLARAAPRRVLLGAMPAVLAAWSVMAWNRSWIWQDQLTLFTRTALEAPYMQRVEDTLVTTSLELPHMDAFFNQPASPAELQQLLPAVQGTLDQLISLYPQNDRVLFARGNTFGRLGDHEEALRLFREAAERSPSTPGYWTHQGQALMHLDRRVEAVEALHHAVSVDPDHLPAHRELAALYWREKNFERALDAFNELQRIAPEEPEFAHWVAQAQAKIDQRVFLEGGGERASGPL